MEMNLLCLVHNLKKKVKYWKLLKVHSTIFNEISTQLNSVDLVVFQLYITLHYKTIYEGYVHTLLKASCQIYIDETLDQPFVINSIISDDYL